MVKIAAMVARENSILNNDRTPKVNITSWARATTAPNPNCHSNLSQIYIKIAISAKDIACKPLNKSSELIVGPTNSDLLNSETLLFIKLLTLLIVWILSSLDSFCNLIIIVFELPNSWRETSLNSGYKIFLKSLILESLVVISINVPPLKSMPKFKPLKKTKEIDDKIKKIEINIKYFLKSIKEIFEFIGIILSKPNIII